MKGVARDWLGGKREEIAERVCPNDLVRTLWSRDQKVQDRVTLALAVADLIAGLVIGMSPITVSVLLVKEGLRILCEQFEGGVQPPGTAQSY